MVHDKLLRDSRSSSTGAAERKAASDTRAAADDLFLTAMAATGVPILRRRLMHAAVVMATRWERGGLSRMGIALWTVASMAGTVALVWSFLAGAWLLAALAIMAPVVGAVLWGPRYSAAVVAGFAAVVIALPALATSLGYGVYWLAEQVMRALAPGAKRSETPPPSSYR